MISTKLLQNISLHFEQFNMLKLPYRFISTISSSAQVGPEHPYFIDVPGQASCQRPLRKRDMKGTLPPPRDVLKTRALRTPKNNSEFILKTTPEPKIQKLPQSEYEAWKRRMAESRKKNLRESIIELHNRKTERHNTLQTLSIGRRKRREKLLRMPQREDERLTLPTITLLNSSLQKGAVPDPNRSTRIAGKIARVKVREESKVQARRDALHTLYMNAREFIVTEMQLDERIKKIFIEEPFIEGDSTDNIWDMGSPPTVRDLLRKYEGETKSATEAFESPAVRIGERMLTIAEEFTGGKIEIESNTVDSV
ncbi:hypothetical protein EV44_g6183 [Erysiphe necator]|uniref:Uncharacterized protein n=1 Tax=Uncinula necator TaxID=52586 RepID=A0A0B1NZ41_UNCNE|nr:hypothetical protein EV44_g6183 [Erysiphe necator]